MSPLIPAAHHLVKYLMLIPIMEMFSSLGIDGHGYAQTGAACGVQSRADCDRLHLCSSTRLPWIVSQHCFPDGCPAVHIRIQLILKSFGGRFLLMMLGLYSLPTEHYSSFNILECT